MSISTATAAAAAATAATAAADDTASGAAVDTAVADMPPAAQAASGQNAAIGFLKRKVGNQAVNTAQASAIDDFFASCMKGADNISKIHGAVSTPYILKEIENGAMVEQASTAGCAGAGMSVTQKTELSIVDLGGTLACKENTYVFAEVFNASAVTMAFSADSPLGSSGLSLFAANASDKLQFGLPVIIKLDKPDKGTIGLVPGLIPYNSMTGEEATRKTNLTSIKPYASTTAVYHTTCTGVVAVSGQVNENSIGKQCGLTKMLSFVGDYATMNAESGGIAAKFQSKDATFFPGLMFGICYDRKYEQMNITNPAFSMKSFDRDIFGPAMPVATALQHLIRENTECYLIELVDNLSTHKHETEQLFAKINKNSHKMGGFFFLPKTDDADKDLTAMIEAAFSFLCETPGHKMQPNKVTKPIDYFPYQDIEECVAIVARQGVKRSVVSCLVHGVMSNRGGVYVIDCQFRNKKQKDDTQLTRTGTFEFHPHLFNDGEKGLKFPFKFNPKTLGEAPLPINIHHHCISLSAMNHMSLNPCMRDVLRIPCADLYILLEFAMYGNRSGMSIITDKFKETAKFIKSNKGEKPIGSLNLSMTPRFGVMHGTGVKDCADITAHMQAFFVDTKASVDPYTNTLKNLHPETMMNILPGLFFHFFKFVEPTDSMSVEYYITKAMDFCVDYQHADSTDRLDFCIIAGKAFMDVMRLNFSGHFKGRSGAVPPSRFATDSLLEGGIGVTAFGRQIVTRLITHMNQTYAVKQLADNDRMDLSGVTDIPLFSTKLFPLVYANYLLYSRFIGDAKAPIMIGASCDLNSVVNRQAVLCHGKAANLSAKFKTVLHVQKDDDEDEEEEEEEEEEEDDGAGE